MGARKAVYATGMSPGASGRVGVVGCVSVDVARLSGVLEAGRSVIVGVREAFGRGGRSRAE